jgi:hypothetical protein
MEQITELTKEYISSKIMEVSFSAVEDTTSIICALTLENDFVVIGVSSCLNELSFDEEEGKNIAYQKAKSKIWELEAYLLKEQDLHENEDEESVEDEYYRLVSKYNSLCQEVEELKKSDPLRHKITIRKKQRKCLGKYLDILSERSLSEDFLG